MEDQQIIPAELLTEFTSIQAELFHNLGHVHTSPTSVIPLLCLVLLALWAAVLVLGIGFARVVQVHVLGTLSHKDITPGVPHGGG